MELKPILIALGVVVLFIGLLTVVINFVGDRNTPLESSVKLPERSEEPPPSTSVKKFRPDTGQNQVLPPSVVVYSEAGFTPKKVIISGSDPNEGCLLTIINSSSAELLIRLSPHSEKDDVGFPYSPIPPGKSLRIDPRYRLEKIVFHNHKNPVQEFGVELGSSCVLK